MRAMNAQPTRGADAGARLRAATGTSAAPTPTAGAGSRPARGADRGAPGRRPGGSPLARQQRRFAILCVAPALILFTFWVAVPSVRAFYYALTSWDGLTPPRYVGLENFAAMAHQGDVFGVALKNNAILMFVPAAFTLALSLGFAAAIHRGVRGARLFRVVFFFPNILSAVAVSVLWLLLYSASDFGVINALLKWMHLRSSAFEFTNSRFLVWSLIPMLVWSSVGFFMLLFLASMQNIPETLYDAARLDGASSVACFRHVTLPLIWETIVIALVFFAIGGLKIFDQIWVFEQQTARAESNTMATLMYSKVFYEYRVGFGTAIAVVLFVMILLATLLVMKLRPKEALEY